MAPATTTASRQPPRHARGFTLIELMVTVAIAIIIATVGIPSFRSLMEGQRIKTASFDIVAMLTLARSEAIKRNTNVTATPAGNNWGQGWVVTTQLGTTPVTLSQQSAMASGTITVTCFQGGAAQTSCAPIIYSNSGRLAPGSQPQAIQLLTSAVSAGSPNQSRCITIDLSGRPMSKKGTC